MAMKTEQEIRKQAIEECIEILKDYDGEGRHDFARIVFNMISEAQK